MEVSGQLHALAALSPGKRAPGTHWIGGWVGARAILDTVVKRKIPSPHQESNPRTPIVQPVAQCYTDWVSTAPISLNVHALTENKSNDMKDSFYEELEEVFNQFPSTK
jgi:hypothetical protein